MSGFQQDYYGAMQDAIATKSMADDHNNLLDEHNKLKTDFAALAEEMGQVIEDDESSTGYILATAEWRTRIKELLRGE